MTVKETSHIILKNAGLGNVLTSILSKAPTAPKILGTGTQALASKVINTFKGTAGQSALSRVNTTAKAIGGSAPLGIKPLLANTKGQFKELGINDVVSKLNKSTILSSKSRENLKGIFVDKSNPYNSNTKGFVQKGIANLYDKVRNTAKLVSGITQGGKITSENLKNTGNSLVAHAKDVWENKHIDMGEGTTGVFKRSLASKGMLAGGTALLAAPALSAAKQVVAPTKDPETGKKKPLINRVGTMGRKTLGTIPGLGPVMHPSQLTPLSVSTALMAKNMM
jgi:hypothetical protein